MADPVSQKTPVVALISGRGSNLQAIIDAASEGTLPIELRAVISNRPGAQGLARATAAGIRTEVIDHKAYPDRDAFEAHLMETIDRYQPQLVVLAGFMRVLGPRFVRHYRGRLINIHPSLLPDYKGLNTHDRALGDAQTEHGASVHFVTEEVDGGPVIIQARVPVHAGDDPQALAARVLEQEHRIYPLAVRWIAEGRVRLADHQILFDGRPMQQPAILRPGQDEPTVKPDVTK